MDEARLIRSELKKHLPESFTSKFSLFTDESNLDINKELIYWCQLYPDGKFIKYLKDMGIFDRIKCFIFVSNWQSELCRKQYGIPGEKVKVIKSACYSLLPEQLDTIIKTKSDSNTIKLCYANAPWKGLRILLSAWEKINTDNCELEILYHNIDKIDMTRIKDVSEKYENVTYVENGNYGDILARMCGSHIMVYPSLYDDVSNVYVSDAISNGLRVITTSTGALPEITEGWARIYSFIDNEEYHSIRLSKVLHDEINKMKDKRYDELLKLQKSVYGPSWNWNNRIHEWKSFISSITNL